MNEQTPLPYEEAIPALARCVIQTAVLLAERRMHLPKDHLGMRLYFANGTSARVFRETVVDGPSKDLCALVVEFRLRFVRGWGHALFRRESLLNTPLFVGFPGFVSKLWMAHDEQGIYRGIYEWDGPEQAQHYARAMWRVLALGCEPQSIHYHVLPGVRRDDIITTPSLIRADAGTQTAWWRLVEAV